MLPKRYRLRENKDFERVFRKGDSIFFGGMTIFVLLNNNQNSRVGITFKKTLKISKPGKNKIKRLLTEAARSQTKLFSLKYDIVFMLTKMDNFILNLKIFNRIINLVINRINKRK